MSPTHKLLPHSKITTAREGPPYCKTQTGKRQPIMHRFVYKQITEAGSNAFTESWFYLRSAGSQDIIMKPTAYELAMR